jgi:hypothetical protein
MRPNIRQIGNTRSERKKEMRVTYLPARSAVTWIWKGGGGVLALRRGQAIISTEWLQGLFFIITLYTNNTSVIV